MVVGRAAVVIKVGIISQDVGVLLYRKRSN